MPILNVLLMLETALSACCLNCDSIDSTYPRCQSCLPNYFLFSSTCLQYCPSSYTTSTSPSECLQSSSSQLIFTNFNEYLSLSTTTAGDFQTLPGKTFSSPSSLTPTLDRGFYSSPSKCLTSTNSFIFAPDITINLYFLPLAEGKIIELVNAVEVWYRTSQICIDLKVL